MDEISEQDRSTRNPRQSSGNSSSSRSGSATDRCRQELDDYDVDFDVRPPSGTNHQQPGKHLSIDTRFSELSLEDSSFIAESEREHSTQHKYGASRSTPRNKNNLSRVQVPKGNFYISSPFKQGPEKDTKGPIMVVDPSHQLKQQTVAGVLKVKRQLESEKRARHLRLHHSQLQRGNLRPLGRPVTASGPAMSQCKGIVAGSRSYHGFTRGRTKSSQPDGDRHLSNSNNSMFGLARPDSPHQKLRPESTFHKTSSASSADPANDDSDGSFSEDESEDSVGVEIQVPYDEGFSHYSTSRNESSSKLTNTCKPYIDPANSNRPRPDDDSDKEEGHWARQTIQCVSCHSNKGRGNGTNKEQMKNRTSSQGKQARLGSCEHEENRCSSVDRNFTSDLVDCLNISASNKSTPTIKNSKKKERGRLDCRKSENREIRESLSSCSELGSDYKIIDVHIVVSERQHATTEGQHVTAVGAHATRDQRNALIWEPEDKKTSKGHVIADRQSSAKEGQNGTTESFGENEGKLIHGFRNDFVKVEDVDDKLEIEALDSDRIPSADIFRVLDNLNLNTSTMKPPTAGSRFRSRRVQSAGHTRTKRDSLLMKRSKRPTSAKKPDEKNSQKNSSSENDISPLTFGRAPSLKPDAREKIPGYFTKEYQKILKEKDAYGKQMGEVHIGAAPSNGLCMSVVHVAKDLAEGTCGSDFGHNENGVKSLETSSSSSGKEVGNISEMPNTERTTLNKSDFIGHDEDNYLEGLNSSVNSASSGVFVTVNNNRELGSAKDAEDSSSGVESMSSVTECSSFKRVGVGSCRNNSSQYTPRGYSKENGGEDENDLDLKSTVNDDGSAGGESVVDENDGFRDNCDENSSNLEVVAKPKPFSESRYLKQKKQIAPFPPVCFSINARPPEGHLYYFAYGPDMNPNRMAIYLRREPKTRLWGILFGFQLCFNKRGTSEEAGGFPNIQFNPEHSVEGCVYVITSTDLAMLDNCMGYPKHYTRAVFPVWMLNSTSPSQHGVAQFCVPAVLYVAQSEWVTDDSSQKLDCSYSVSQCMKASDILTPNYVEFLSNGATSWQTLGS